VYILEQGFAGFGAMNLVFLVKGLEEALVALVSLNLRASLRYGELYL
jgi:hypothetical protein